MAAPKKHSDCTAIEDSQHYSSWSLVTVGVADMNAALHLWIDLLGFNVVSFKDGEDEDLARLWKLQPSDIACQAIVRTNDSNTGMIHFVQFNNPDDPVRIDARNFDLVPKTLDVYVEDLPEKVKKLRAVGVTFQTDIHSDISAPDGTEFREIKILAHDVINISMIEVVGKSRSYNKVGFAGVGPFAYTVADANTENQFFASTFLVEKLHENFIQGPEIEKAIGLPKGTVLHTNVWGREGCELGEVEIVEYSDLQGKNLFPRARPKALGILHLCYLVPNMSLLKKRLIKQEIEFSQYDNVRTFVGSGNLLSFSSPAGLRFEVYEVSGEEPFC